MRNEEKEMVVCEADSRKGGKRMGDTEKMQMIDTIEGQLMLLNEHDLQGVEARVEEIIRLEQEKKRQRVEALLKKLESFSKEDIGRVMDFLFGVRKTREKLDPSDASENSDISEAGFSGAEEVSKLPYDDEEDEAGVPVDSLTPTERRRYETEEVLSALRVLAADDVEYLPFDLAGKIESLLRAEIEPAFAKFEKDLREQIRLEAELAELKGKN